MSVLTQEPQRRGNVLGRDIERVELPMPHDPITGRFAPTPTVSCSVEGCERDATHRGWCLMHYKRWRKHGDPLAVVTKGWKLTPREGSENSNYRHGGARRGTDKLPEYRTWQHLRERCQNPNDKRYADYGGRGITVCARWDPKQGGSFENFLADVGPKPGPQYSIDRKDNDGPYSPDNCRWATPLEQRHNQRRARRDSSASR